MNRRFSNWLVANLLGLVSLNVLACGYCLEDRIASVYDHVLVAKTKQLNQKMLYLIWDGPANRDEAMRHELISIASRLPGITKGSVRVSLEPATIGLAYQPLKISREQVEALLLQRLKPKRIVVSSLPE